MIGANRSTVDEDFDNTGYSIGFNYEFTHRHAIFGHYTDSAKLPHFDDVRNGVLVKDPGDQHRAGLQGLARALVRVRDAVPDRVRQRAVQRHSRLTARPRVAHAETRTRGIELEGELQPIDALDVRFSITQQDPKYHDFRFRDAAGDV